MHLHVLAFYSRDKRRLVEFSCDILVIAVDLGNNRHNRVGVGVGRACGNEIRRSGNCYIVHTGMFY